LPKLHAALAEKGSARALDTALLAVLRSIEQGKFTMEEFEQKLREIAPESPVHQCMRNYDYRFFDFHLDWERYICQVVYGLTSGAFTFHSMSRGRYMVHGLERFGLSRYHVHLERW
jgi:hypothetical protein